MLSMVAPDHASEPIPRGDYGQAHRGPNQRLHLTVAVSRLFQSHRFPGRRGTWQGPSAARFGLIDRSIGEITSRLDAICTLVTIDS